MKQDMRNLVKTFKTMYLRIIKLKYNVDEDRVDRASEEHWSSIAERTCSHDQDNT